eukprot:TRINITY_DN1953_c0_g2_i3.p1 TRINITY_DN1953_c0_g2~~TRINITY_DN1953_c0_g2_i3.p1  ORF type:complete len:1956 (+),score=221.90 TRINITY_DN1953_c0_g2_i3:86-5953(+)
MIHRSIQRCIMLWHFVVIAMAGASNNSNNSNSTATPATTVTTTSISSTYTITNTSITMTTTNSSTTMTATTTGTSYTATNTSTTLTMTNTTTTTTITTTTVTQTLTSTTISTSTLTNTTSSVTMTRTSVTSTSFTMTNTTASTSTTLTTYTLTTTTTRTPSMVVEMKPDTCTSGWEPQYSREIQAFQQWVAKLGVKKNSNMTACSADALAAGLYAQNATYHQQVNGVDTAVLTDGPASSVANFCGLFGSDVGDANAGLISVEHCNGIWRGSFAPLRNASGVDDSPEMNALLENEPRNFVIWGYVQADGQFVATRDYTCLGPCIVSYPWSCVSSAQRCNDSNGSLWDLCDPIEEDNVSGWGPMYSDEIMPFVKWTSSLGVKKDATTCPTSPTLSLDMDQIVEEAYNYSDNGTQLNGMLIYQRRWVANNQRRPGLVLYGGPWGDGGGDAEREYAKVYAAKGMVVFLPDYFTETCSDTDQVTLLICLTRYFGGFLNDTAYAQRIALLAYTTLKAHPMVIPDKIGAIGFCFGGAMALQAARAGAQFEVAVSLHGEYPPHNFANPAPWATKYFVEMVGYDDPLIPVQSRNAWMSELSNVTAGTNATGEVQVWLNTVHAFSIQYSAAFIGILRSNYPAGRYGDGMYPGAVMYDKATAERCFDKIDFLFQRYGLIHARTVPANPALKEPRSTFGEMGDVVTNPAPNLSPGYMAFGHYADNATFYQQDNCQTWKHEVGGANVADLVLCKAFGPQVADANAGLISVEHCKGIWRGSFAPYRDASGGAPSAAAQALMESMPRHFVIWGSVQANGTFVATTEYTCMGPCNVSYPWTCSATALVNNLTHRLEFTPSTPSDKIQCYQNAFNQDGSPTGSTLITVDASSGCPSSCNPTWEVSCTFSGSEYCALKSDGCPVVCGQGQQYCYGNTYDQSGSVTGQNISCAAASASCSCNAKWEATCKDSSGSYCVSRLTGCPLECRTDERVCFSQVFDPVTKLPDWSQPVNQSCHPISSPCPCNSLYQDTCIDGRDTYCQTRVEGSCPLSCLSGQRICSTWNYSSGAEIESCVPDNEPCPCAPIFETKCSDSSGSWCELVSIGCPLTCEFGICTDWSTGNRSCATSTGCPCSSEQLSCTEYGFRVCYTGITACPVVCDNASAPMLCNTIGFNASLFPSYTQQCLAATTDFTCPVRCDSASAKMCGSGAGAYCIPASDACPVECTASEREVFIDMYNAQGQITGFNRTCLKAGEPLQCGAYAILCTSFDGDQYCQPKSVACPVICNATTQKTCEPLSFTTAGAIDTSASATTSCVPKSSACPCGTNAKRCNVVDDYGQADEWCVPTTESCPVFCSAGTRECDIWNFNASGYPAGSEKRCVAAERPCPCGNLAQQCAPSDICVPFTNFWTGKPQSCPVYCTAMEDSCDIPSFGARGNLISMEETCVPRGTACDCSKGQNAVACNMTFGGATYVECISRSAYCPQICSAGQVTCPQLDDFSVDGRLLGSRAPRKACAASYSACECGSQAKQCTQGDFSWCIPTVLDCPVTCRSNEKKCFVYDFSAAGDWDGSSREVCVPANATCPCGRNAGTCPGDDLCLATADLQALCPCLASEKECTVQDFGRDGLPSGFSSVCVAQSTTCPCGANAKRCLDPNDITENYCIPQLNQIGEAASCPTPCTPSQLRVNETCVQINMGETGGIIDETITCVAKGSCTPGRNMKQCPSGGVVHSSVQCVDLYGLGDGNTQTVAVAEGVQETAQVFIGVTAGANSAKGTNSASALVRNLLQLPRTLSLTMTMKSTTPKGGGRRMATSNAQLGFEFKNVGASRVSTEAAAGQLKKVFQTGELTSAVAAVGEVDTKSAPVVKTETKQIVTREASAVNAGLVPPTPTPPPSPSPSPRWVPSPTSPPSPAPSPSPVPVPVPNPSPSPVPVPISLGDGEASDASGITFSFMGLFLLALGNLPGLRHTASSSI